MRILRFFVVVYDPEDAEHLRIYSIFTYLVIKSIQSAEKILLDIRLFILDILHKLILYLLVCNIIHICSFKPYSIRYCRISSDMPVNINIKTKITVEICQD